MKYLGHCNEKKSLTCHIFSTAWAVPTTLLLFFSFSLFSHHLVPNPRSLRQISKPVLPYNLSYPSPSYSWLGNFFHNRKDLQWMLLLMMVNNVCWNFTMGQVLAKRDFRLIKISSTEQKMIVCAFYRWGQIFVNVSKGTKAVRSMPWDLHSHGMIQKPIIKLFFKRKTCPPSGQFCHQFLKFHFFLPCYIFLYVYLETIKTFLTEDNGNDHLLFSLLYILKFFLSKTYWFSNIKRRKQLSKLD